MQKTDYKNTLNLPKTNFPMKANLFLREKEILNFWENIDLYSRMQEKNRGQKKFILHDGPPYANGKIHLGTSLNKILKDIILKSKNLDGFYTPYNLGWDCHGLPIELKVEKKFGKPCVNISETEFREKCREYAKKQVERQYCEFKRLGIITDWKNPYLTMDYSHSAEVVRIVDKLVKRKYIIRKEKPVHWCVDCMSALAEAEVEYMNKKSKAIDVMFQAKESKTVFPVFSYEGEKNFDIFFPIWTTTPWTIPSNKAVCINPEENYALVSCEINSKLCALVLAEDLIASSMSRFLISNYQILSIVNGRKLEKIPLYHPIYKNTVPVVLGNHVTVKDGTGNIHTSPAHGQEDHIVCLKYDISSKSSIDDKGYFIEDIDLFSRKKYSQSEDLIIDIIRNNGLLISYNIIQHSYPHCWRHKTPLVFRSTPQWFIPMEGDNNLRSSALKAVDSVKWIPDWGSERMKSMLRSRPDWCISRQRFWGNPITLILDQEIDDLYIYRKDDIKNISEGIERLGNEYWFDNSIEKFTKETSNQKLVKVKDVLDVWFDSGVTHECVLKKKYGLGSQADLYLEGTDQYRGWFQASLLTSVILNNQPPYKTVLTHGFVVDAKGRKMSKSLGNTVSPEKIINDYGADILRLWVASSNFKEDISFSNEIISRVSDAYRRIRNTIRFLLSNLHDFNIKTDYMSPEDLLSIDLWILEKTIETQKEIIRAFNNYQFQAIYKLVHNFCTTDMGSFYLDIIKDRLYTSLPNGKLRRSAQNTLYYILESIVRWIAPILSFTAEEAWKHMCSRGEDSVFLSRWFDKFPKKNLQIKHQIDWDFLSKTRSEVNRAIEKEKLIQNIKSTLDVEVTIYADSTKRQKLEIVENELRFLFISSTCKLLSLEKKPECLKESPMLGLFIGIKTSTNNKCERCWQRYEKADFSLKINSICLRCEKALANQEECRNHV